MPRVPFDPYADVAPSQQGTPGFTQQANPNDFGANIGQALGQAGDVGAQIANARQGLINESLATDAQTATVAKASALFDQYRSLNGKDAAAGLSDFTDQLNKVRTDAYASLPNPAAQRMFDQTFRRYQDGMIMSASQHAAAETQKWHISSAVAAAQNWEDQGVYWRNDPTRVNQFLNSGLGEVQKRGEIEGWDDTQIAAGKAAYAGHFWTSVIGATAGDDPLKAKSILDQVRGQLPGPTQAALEEHLAPQVRGRTADAIVDNVLPLTPPAAGANAPVPENLVQAFAGQESGNGANTSTSVTGARGKFQIEPATFQQYAKPGENIDNPTDNEAVARRYIGDLWQKSGGDVGRTAVGYFSGPGNMAPSDSATPYVTDASDPTGKKTSAYVTDILNRVGPPASQYDDPSLATRALAMAGSDPQQQMVTLERLRQRQSLLASLNAQDRMALDRDLRNLEPALLQGADVAIPEQRIRALQPPQQANETLTNLQVSAAVGQVLKSVQFATPQELAKVQTDLTSGLGDYSTMLRLRLAQRDHTPVIDANGQPVPETAEAFNLRKRAADMVVQAITQRQQLLTADPAGYAAAAPQVAAAAKAIDPDKPDTFDAYVNTTKDFQTHLGVQPQDQRVLATSQSRAIAGQLLSADPSKTDAGAQLDKMETQYGKSWPDVWHDLVRDGNMPPEWQVLAQMPAGPDRIAMQRALQAAREKGGVEAMRKDIDSTKGQQIDQGLDAALDDFRQTVMIPGLSGDANLFSGVRSAVRTLAMWNTLNGQDAKPALASAVDAALPYDFEGIARAPKGQGALASSVAATTLANLKPDDLAPPQGGTGMKPDDVQAAYLAAVRRSGMWVTNERGDGWTLAARGNDGAWQFPQRAGGGRIGFKFADMPALSASQPRSPMNPDTTFAP